MLLRAVREATSGIEGFWACALLLVHLPAVLVLKNGPRVVFHQGPAFARFVAAPAR
jgi:hypothetical protein